MPRWRPFYPQLRSTCLPLLLLALVMLGHAPARAGEVTEPASGHKFSTPLTYNGKPYTLLGAGIRKKFVVKVYAMALYADEAAAKQGFPTLVNKAGGQDRAKLLEGEKAQTWVVYSRFAKLGVLHFVRDVDKDKVQGAYRESLESALSEKAAPELRRDAEAFLALFDRDVREGQEVKIHTDEGGRISVEIAGQKKDGPQNPQLCRMVWEIWLGPKTISKDLRKNLVERIDELGR